VQAARRIDLEAANRMGLDDAGAGRAILSSQNLMVHFIEGYTPRQLAEFDSTINEYSQTEPFVRLICSGRISEALELEERMIRDAVLHWVMPRDQRMLRGFNALGSELPQVFGVKQLIGEIRLLARFGTAHMAVVGKLKEMGYDAAAAPDSDVITICHELEARLSANPGSKITSGEAVKLLFQRMWEGTGGHLGDEGERELSLHISGKFERAGSEQGFLSLLSEAARQGGEEAFEEFIKRAIHGSD